MAAQQASGRFEEFMRGALITNNAAEAQYFASLAQAEALARIGDLLEELVEMAKEEMKPEPLPCNEMGGGSAGLDTADDFAMHCDKEHGHDGPHSYEES